MSFIGKNIKKIRTVKKLSQASFAKLFNLARPSVGAYEEGRAEPKIETLIQIAQYFSISIDVLLTKELTINELYQFDIFDENLKKDSTTNEQPWDNRVVTSLVLAGKKTEYIVNRNRKDYIQGMPNIQFPNTSKILSRAFEINGDAMQNNESGLHQGDILLTVSISPDKMDDIDEGSIYAVVTEKDIVIRRLDAKSDMLRLQGDNPNYKPILIPKDSVLEIWQALGVYSTYLKKPALIDDRVTKLEFKLQELTNVVERLKL